MGRRINNNMANRALSVNVKWDPQQALAEALTERNRFLEQNPDYIPYQQEINRILDKAGSAENRMTVLALLMEAKLVELHQQFKDLSHILMRSS
jgi:hypothetical protein